jgi:hypothetical protein
VRLILVVRSNPIRTGRHQVISDFAPGLIAADEGGGNIGFQMSRRTAKLRHAQRIAMRSGGSDGHSGGADGPKAQLNWLGRNSG